MARNSLNASRFVDENRLWKHHMEMAEYGKTPKGGVNRQALSPEEIEARKQLFQWARELNLQSLGDAAGNLFFRREGIDPGGPPVMTGSHIDSQPTGGKFDGTYGVLAAFEAVRALNMAKIKTLRPIEIAVWMNEEGSRFAPGMMGSEAFSGIRNIKKILSVQDKDGMSVSDELKKTEQAIPPNKIVPLERRVSAFVEAHIEQGPILEKEQKTIGVVTGIQGVRRMRVKVIGEESHAGTTPRSARKDALWEATRMISALHDKLYVDDDVRFTIGMIRPAPNVPSVIASEVIFSIDIRHPESKLLEKLAGEVDKICKGQLVNCEAETWRIAEADSIAFPTRMVKTIEDASNRLGISNMQIFSGAGHDARQLHFICPTGMIFIPCEKGISHNEAENVAPKDLADGTRVLCETLLELAGTISFAGN